MLRPKIISSITSCRLRAGRKKGIDRMTRTTAHLFIAAAALVASGCGGSGEHRGTLSASEHPATPFAAYGKGAVSYAPATAPPEESPSHDAFDIMSVTEAKEAAAPAQAAPADPEPALEIAPAPAQTSLAPSPPPPASPSPGVASLQPAAFVPDLNPEIEEIGPPSLECPQVLCGGIISPVGVGDVPIGSTREETASALERPIAPKADSFRREPNVNIFGVILSFCGENVCRIEITVRPPLTAEGFGVDSKLSKLASKYGQSKCRPIDAKRFGVEFERLEGVVWISDRLDCEGIEDLDFWDRPLVGTVTSVIVGSPGN